MTPEKTPSDSEIRSLHERTPLDFYLYFHFRVLCADRFFHPQVELTRPGTQTYSKHSFYFLILGSDFTIITQLNWTALTGTLNMLDLSLMADVFQMCPGN